MYTKPYEQKIEEFRKRRDRIFYKRAISGMSLAEIGKGEGEITPTSVSRIIDRYLLELSKKFQLPIETSEHIDKLIEVYKKDIGYRDDVES